MNISMAQKINEGADFSHKFKITQKSGEGTVNEEIVVKYAEQLNTPHTISGETFNGTQDVIIPLAATSETGGAGIEIGSGAGTDKVVLKGAGITSITQTDASTITVTSTEVDTLNSVTTRGATTANGITVGSLTVDNIGIDGNTISTSSGTLILDPSPVGNAGTVVIKGDLQIDGTTTTINSTELVVNDKNITLASGSANKAAANGAGITVDLGTDGTTQVAYNSTTGKWNVDGDSISLDSHTLLEAGTGATEFGGISAGTNPATQFNVGPLKGHIVDNITNPAVPTDIEVQYAGATNLTTPYLAGSGITYLMINSLGQLVMQDTQPTPSQRRANILIGRLAHPAGTIVNRLNMVDYVQSPVQQIRDIWNPIKLINEGVYPFPNGANLSLNLTQGKLWGSGINFHNDRTNPNSFAVGPTTLVSFNYRTQTGLGANAQTVLQPGNYDNAGTITAIGGSPNQATNQRVFITQNGQLIIQYGQVVYGSMAEAIAGASNESFITFQNLLDNAILIAIITLKRNATNLQDIAQARILLVGKFGEAVGAAGGLATTTLQNAYNNSTIPQITTNATTDGVVIKQGSGLDTDSLIIFQNGAGTQTGKITGEGKIIAQALIKEGGLSTQYLMADGTISTGTSAQNTFDRFAVSGQDTVLADSATDTLTLVGSGMTSITTNATTDTITISTPTPTLAQVTTAGSSTTNAISTGAITSSGNVQGTTLTSTVATGTAPLTVASITKVTNLNADLLDGYNSDQASSANTVVVRDGNKYIIAGAYRMDNAGTVGVGGVTVDTGRIEWNPTDGTFNMHLLKGVNLQSGQEVHFYGIADGAVTNGNAVMFKGVDGSGNYRFGKADRITLNANASYIMGIATVDIPNGEYGYVTWFGKVNGLNTNAWTAGTILYVDTNSGATLGALTSTLPSAPNAKIEIAAVVKQGTTDGVLLVRPTIFQKFSDSQDVLITSIGAGDTLYWNGTNSRWENNSTVKINPAGTGNVPLQVNALNGHTGNLQEWKVNGTTLSRFNQNGYLYTPGVVNTNGTANAFLDMTTNGAVISRNIADANTSLKVDLVNNTSTGNIQEWYSTISSTNALRARLTKDGSFFGTNITLSGDLTVNGTVNTIYAEDIYTEKDHIFLRNGAIGGLAVGAFAGIIAKLADGTNDAGLVFDGNGMARVGDITYSGLTPLYTNTQAIATREDAPISSAIAYWNDTSKRFDTDSNIVRHASGQLRASYFVTNGGMFAQTGGADNSFVNTSTTGTIISRNIADANAALVVNQVNASSTGDILKVQAAGTDRLTVKRDGNVGIGITTPAAKLSIHDANNANTYLQLTNNATGTALTDGLILLQGSLNSTFINRENGYMAFETNNTEKVRILADGNVGIGVTGPTAQLQVKSSSTTKVPMVVDAQTSQTANLQEWKVNGVTLGYIDKDGKLVATDVTVADEVKTLNNFMDYWDNIASSGRLFGGKITANPNGTISIEAGGGLSKPDDVPLSGVGCTIECAPPILNQGQSGKTAYVTWAAVPSLTLVDNAYNFIYYEGSTGLIKTTIDFYSISFTRDFTLGRAFRTGNDVIVRLCGTNLWNFNRRVQLFGEEAFPVLKTSGLIPGFSGRYISFTAGILWAELVNRFSVGEFTTVPPSVQTFSYWYRNGAGGWTRTNGNTQINNTQFDDGDGTLGTVPVNRYGVHWLYVVHDSTAHVVFGQGSYTLAQADLAAPPATLPGLLASYATLIGKYVILRNATTITSVRSPDEVTFTASSVTNHNDLSNIQGGLAGEYFHMSSAEYTKVQGFSSTGTLTDITVRNSAEGIVPLKVLGLTATTANLQEWQTNVASPTTVASINNLGNITGRTLNSTVAIGTAPLTVTSTTKVTNLNSDLLDDQDGSYYLNYNNFTNTPTIGNGQLSMGVSGVGISGTATFTANQTGNTTFTVTSNATDQPTASTIVARDASGDVRTANRYYYSSSAYTVYNSTDKSIDFVFTD
jgi:hypothetical protein